MLHRGMKSHVALAGVLLLAIGCAAEWEQSGTYEESESALSWGVKLQQKKGADAGLQTNNTKEDATILQDSKEDDTEVEPQPDGCPSLYVKCPTCIGPDGTCQKNKVCLPGDDGVIS